MPLTVVMRTRSRVPLRLMEPVPVVPLVPTLLPVTEVPIQLFAEMFKTFANPEIRSATLLIATAAKNPAVDVWAALEVAAA